ncbi:MAG: tetraacyldisaccharide 4'-kinase [Desulfobia sp.]
MKPERVNILYSLGRPFAPLYGAIMNVRAALYHKNILKKTSLEVPVISVGNLTMGGTGKTPMAIYLAGLMRKKNPVVVSRGYHGTSTDKINVVSDGNSLLMGVREAGDESYLMARALPGIPVVTGRSKRLTAEYAVRHFNPGLVIVDDGFQHLGLARDLNMVMFKVDTLLGNNRVFPAGDMREPLKALERADCFVLNCVDDENRQKAEAIEKALNKRFPEIPVFKTAYRPTGVVDQNGRGSAVAEVKGKKCFGFCGLADPSYFQRVLEDSGMELAGVQTYPDHHFYSEKDLEEIAITAQAAGAELLVTTAKDMVKLQDCRSFLPVVSVQMELVPFEGLADFIRERISA